MTATLCLHRMFQRRPNYSSPYAPPRLTNVSLPTYQNIYIYDRATLWIAYGLSILFTTLVAIAGIIALLLNGASYSDNFSTIVRVTRTADLSTDILDKDRDSFGRDPLPEYLKHARLNIKSINSEAGANAGGNADSTKMVETQVEEEQSFIASPRTDKSRKISSIERRPSLR